LIISSAANADKDASYLPVLGGQRLFMSALSIYKTGPVPFPVVKNEYNRACSKTRLVSEQAFGKPAKSPVFLSNSRKLFQKLKFWNSLNTYTKSVGLFHLRTTLL
jgi:hypothetical protein